MKKQKKPPQKKKEFAATPFKALKGFSAETREEQEEQVKKPAVPQPADGGADDADLFLRAVADVKRLGGGEGVGEKGKKPLPVPRKIDEDERRVFLQALDKLHLDVTFQDELHDDALPLRPLPVNRMRQLKRGAIRIDYELDLHGLTRDEALESLAPFITGAYNRGQKGVLVITGKGNNSPGEPVLIGAIAGWLRDQGKGMVAEFAPAPRHMGGGGAFVVFLKDKAKDRGAGSGE